MNLPCNYKSIFSGKVIVIGGVGRSGTTILGKIIDSMNPVVYLMEPTIIKYLPYFCDQGGLILESVLGTIFEDYISPTICQKYKTFRRFDVMDWIKENNPVYVIKSNELQPQLDLVGDLFGGIKYIEIIRNGLHVVDSSIHERGWFKDDYQQIYFHIGGVPYYIDSEDRKLWPKWSPVTRAACNYRTLLEHVPDCIPVLRYEELKTSFQKIMTEMPGNVNVTNDTFELIDSVYGEYKPKVSVEDIQRPEREKFMAKMKELGYVEM